MGFSLGGFFNDTLDAVTDFVKDPIKTTGNAIDSTWHALGDLGQYAGAQGQSLYNNLDNVAKTELKQFGANFSLPFDSAANIAEDPLDPQSYTKGIADWYSESKRLGEEQYGTGGYAKAAANTLSSGNPFSGAGNAATQAWTAANGGEYKQGNTAGAQNLASLWNLGTNIYDGVSAPSGSTPTYYEAGADGSSVAVNPGQIYQTGGVPTMDGMYSSDGVDLNNQADIGANASNNFTYQEMGADGQPVNVRPDLYNYNTTPGQFLNSPMGQVGRAFAGAVDPTLGSILNAGAGAYAGDAGAVAKSLGGWYVNNKAEQQQKKYQDQIQQQLSFLNQLYSPNGQYSQELRKRLAAKDAAAGRNSQYGDREVQLMSALADKTQNLAPSVNLLTNGAMQTSMQAQHAARSRQLGTLMGMFQSPGKATNAQGQVVNQQAPAMQGWDDFKNWLGS